MTSSANNSAFVLDISTHTPHTRRDIHDLFKQRRFWISTHTPHTRRDFQTVRPLFSFPQFLLTRLIRGVTGFTFFFWFFFKISTHTPHTRRDIDGAEKLSDENNFYSHASYEAWPARPPRTRRTPQFLLTRLIRGVTRCIPASRIIFSFLLTRLIRGVTIAQGATMRAVEFLLTRLIRGVTAKYISFCFHTTICRRTIYKYKLNNTFLLPYNLKFIYFLLRTFLEI